MFDVQSDIYMTTTTPEPPQGVLNIKAALTSAPQKPGVYLMKDARGKVIYVGKAKRLRNRLASYTRWEEFPGYYRQKVQAMTSKVGSVDFVVTGNEKEALLLENTLIKKHRPRYNVDLRDDKNYPLFRLSLQDDYPRLSLVRKPGSDGARYFGPFGNAGAARRTMHLLQRIFPLRRCSDHTMRNRTRPCLDYDTGRCAAPCTGKISGEKYRELAKQIEAFFSGKGGEVAANLERDMAEASRAMEYEKAAILRDRLQALQRTLEEQHVSNAEGGDMDAFALHQDEGIYRLAVSRVRAGRLVGSRVHDLSQAVMEPGQALGQALLSYYADFGPPPPMVLVSHMPPDPGLVVEVLGDLAERKVELRKPQRGEKLRVMELALLNAAQPRHQKGRSAADALERLARALDLEDPPESMECMDISHLGGRLTVASVVAMLKGEADKNSYRRYKIISANDEPDDFGSMREVVTRRLGGDRPPPDLLVVDGGKGQLSSAIAAMEELEPERRPPVIALAKGKDGDPDKVFVPNRKNPLNLKGHDPALLLLMRLRDEAHRFAITYHRMLRKKAFTRSVLEEVGGIGPKRVKRLLKAFGSLAGVKQAGAAQYEEKAGLDKPTAARLEAFLGALDTMKGGQ